MKDYSWKRVPWHIGEGTRKELEQVCEEVGMPQLERCADNLLKLSIEIIRSGENITSEEERYVVMGLHIISSSFLLYRLTRAGGIREKDEVTRILIATISSIQEERGIGKDELFIALTSILVRLFANLHATVEKNVIRGNLTSIDDETAERLLDLLENVGVGLDVIERMERKGTFFKITLKKYEPSQVGIS